MKHPTDCSSHLAANDRSHLRWVTIVLLAAFALLPMSQPKAWSATAISNYWDPGHSGTTPGSGGGGTWDLSTANWVQFPNGGDNLYRNSSSGGTYFQGVAGTVNLNANGIVTPNINPYTPGYVLQDTPGTSYSLTINGGISAQNTSGTVTVSIPATMTNTFGSGLSVLAGGTLAVTGNLTVSNALYLGGDVTNGTVIVAGNNTINGPTIVQEGVAVLAGMGTSQPVGGTSRVSVIQQSVLMYATGSSNQIPTATPVTLDNGTFNVNGQSQDRAHALGALTLSSNSALDFGSVVSASSVLAFGKSSAVAWSGTLSVYDYRGTPGTGGGVDELFFGTDATGLTASQLSEISFYSGGSGSTLLGTGIILSTGEVTYAPVPEPATWLGGVLLGLGGAGLRCQRSRRLARSMWPSTRLATRLREQVKILTPNPPESTS